MVQKWERCKLLQLISPINTDHAIFIWKSKPDSSFSRKLWRYQNREILLSLNVIALSNSYMLIRYMYKFVYVYPNLTWIGIFFCKIAFTLNCWLLCLLGCLTYIIERAITFAILEKQRKEKLKILMWYTY